MVSNPQAIWKRPTPPPAQPTSSPASPWWSEGSSSTLCPTSSATPPTTSSCRSRAASAPPTWRPRQRRYWSWTWRRAGPAARRPITCSACWPIAGHGTLEGVTAAARTVGMAAAVVAAGVRAGRRALRTAAKKGTAARPRCCPRSPRRKTAAAAALRTALVAPPLAAAAATRWRGGSGWKGAATWGRTVLPTAPSPTPARPTSPAGRPARPWTARRARRTMWESITLTRPVRRKSPPPRCPTTVTSTSICAKRRFSCPCPWTLVLSWRFHPLRRCNCDSGLDDSLCKARVQVPVSLDTSSVLKIPSAPSVIIVTVVSTTVCVKHGSRCPCPWTLVLSWRFHPLRRW